LTISTSLLAVVGLRLVLNQQPMHSALLAAQWVERPDYAMTTASARFYELARQGTPHQRYPAKDNASP